MASWLTNSESFTLPADMLIHDVVITRWRHPSTWLVTWPVLGDSRSAAPGSVCICPGGSPAAVRTELAGHGGHLHPEVTPPSTTGTRLPLILPHFSHFSKSWIWKTSVYFNLLPIFAFYLHFILKKFQTKSTNQYKLKKINTNNSCSSSFRFQKLLNFVILASSFFLLSQVFFLNHLIVSFWIILWYP